MNENIYFTFLISKEQDLIGDIVIKSPTNIYFRFTKHSERILSEPLNIKNYCLISIFNNKTKDSTFNLSKEQVDFVIKYLNNKSQIVDNNNYGKVIKEVSQWSEIIDEINYEIFWNFGNELDSNLHYNSELFANNLKENRTLPNPYLPIDLDMPNFNDN